MTKIADGVHTTDDGSRLFLGPDVTRYPRQDDGEVVVLEHGTDIGEGEVSTDGTGDRADG